MVSNREPYLHNQNGNGSIVATPATGGVAVALDALMRERGGVWIAHGAGSADRLVVDSSGRVMVPPDNPSYQLRRLWIDEPAFSAYYGGFSNEGLWPLCHMVDVRPQFRSEDWAAYQDVNVQFAAAIDAELVSPNTPIFIQDYHLAMVAPGAPRPAPRRAYRVVLAHPVAVSRPFAHLSVATRDSRGSAGQRPARVSTRARSPQLPACGRRRARGGDRRRSVGSATERPP